jgi:diamine N-acetyltransferase
LAVSNVAVSEVSVRRGTVEDAQALALVGSATFLDSFAGILEGKSIVQHCKVNHAAEVYAGYLERPDCRIWLAETAVKEGPVGYAMLTKPDLPIADPRLDDVELKRIYVLTRFHGTGTGRRLMETAMDEARTMGRRRIFLGVYGGNLRAIAFYERAGFRVTGSRTFQMGFTIYDDLVLGRDL